MVAISTWAKTGGSRCPARVAAASGTRSTQRLLGCRKVQGSWDARTARSEGCDISPRRSLRLPVGAALLDNSTTHQHHGAPSRPGPLDALVAAQEEDSTGPGKRPRRLSGSLRSPARPRRHPAALSRARPNERSDLGAKLKQALEHPARVPRPTRHKDHRHPPTDSISQTPRKPSLPMPSVTDRPEISRSKRTRVSRRGDVHDRRR